jgi:hypothetical protein
MKKIIVSFLMASVISSVLCQSSLTLKENESVLIYSLPMTELCIKVDVEKITRKPGVFYRYSERYLATSDIITEEKTVYSLKDIQVTSNAVPDPSKTYAVRVDKNSPFVSISVDQNGLLCGINVPPPTSLPELSVLEPTETKENLSNNVILPLGEEYMLVGSVAKLAEGAAKQIYRIRESRLNLLTGDVDHFPSDGTSLSAILNELDNKEKELTELFIGSTTKEIQKHTLYLRPQQALNNEVLFRFSVLKGLVPADDLSGVPYYISVIPTKSPTILDNPKQKAPKEYINFVIPSATLVTVSDGKSTFFSQQFLFPQFGIVIPLSSSMIKGNDKIVIIDPATGRLLSIF